MAQLARARSIEELQAKMARMITPQGKAYGDAFIARPDDIIVTTYAKAGTTWMQQIVHGLRTGGDMDFSEITEVVPWINLAGDLGLDLEGEQKANPRAFKSHENWDNTPHNCRYIYVVRDPIDSAVSFYNFMNGWFLEPGTVALDEFIETFYLKRKPSHSYWEHLLSWWPQLNNPAALFLCYEDMQADLPGTVQTVARFMGVEDQNSISIATHQASFEFMKQHNRHFDDHLITDARNKDSGLPADAHTTKVNKGKVGGNRNLLSDTSRSILDQAWHETITAELGFADYAALRAML